MAKKTTTWSEYRAETVHLVGGKPDSRGKKFSAVSDDHARGIFNQMCKADPTIREAVLL